MRYPTSGTLSMSEAQPFYVNSPYGIVLAHNGNLTNVSELRHYLDFESHRHINTDSDSELLLNILADKLNRMGKVRIVEEDVFEAFEDVYQKCRGGYSAVAMIAGFGLIGFRDVHGIRPIVLGERKNGSGQMDYMFASESVVLDVLGYKNARDVKPGTRHPPHVYFNSHLGEVIVITKDGPVSRQCAKAGQFTPCIFEYVYFARPDSIMNGISVYKARLAMGEELAKQVKLVLGSNLDVDVVIPVCFSIFPSFNPSHSFRCQTRVG